MTIEVRRVRAADHARIRALAPELLAGMADWRPAAGRRAAVVGWVDAALAGADRDDRAVFVAVAPDDAVVGFAGVTERGHFTGQREGYVGELVVAPEYRARGAARGLMAAAEDWVRRRGLTRLSLETGSANAPARAAYARLGYVEEQVTLTKALA